MKIRSENEKQIRPQDKDPDRTRCMDQRSRDLRGKPPGDRGMCEKQSSSQGSE
jgi:hypothetical protein